MRRGIAEFISFFIPSPKACNTLYIFQLNKCLLLFLNAYSWKCLIFIGWQVLRKMCFPRPCAYYNTWNNMSRYSAKLLKWHVCPGKSQISLHIFTILAGVFAWHSLGGQRAFLHANSKDPDQTMQMCRLIWVFAELTCHFVGLTVPWLIHLVWNAEIAVADFLYLFWCCCICPGVLASLNVIIMSDF